jgi:hypothetical protein
MAKQKQSKTQTKLVFKIAWIQEAVRLELVNDQNIRVPIRTFVIFFDYDKNEVYLCLFMLCLFFSFIFVFFFLLCICL